VAGHARLVSNRPGAHYLRDGRVAAELVRHAGVGPDDLVLDLGAGTGAITAPLAATGARVLAVERDERLARRLARRFAADDRVRVVHGDLLRIPLPRRRHLVVASIPFATSSALLHRLLDRPATAMAAADLVVAWGLAVQLSAPRQRGLDSAWWAGRFSFRLVRRLASPCFSPPPSVDAAHLAIRPRPLAASGPGQRVLRELLGAAYARPPAPLRAVVAGSRPGAGLSHRRIGRLLASVDLDPAWPATSPTGAQWHDLAALLTPGRS
jgi:23S rRNA (adenine-N6)-dimethyltransferase